MEGTLVVCEWRAPRELHAYEAEVITLAMRAAALSMLQNFDAMRPNLEMRLPEEADPE